MEQEIKHWLQANIYNDTSVDQKANWVAVDLLRHLGKGEKPAARKVIREFSPELAHKIQEVYPHRWF